MADDRPTTEASPDANGGGSLLTLNYRFFERLFLLTLLVYVGYVLVATMGYNQQAQLVPLTIGIPTALLLLGLLVRQVYDARIRDDGDDEEAADRRGDVRGVLARNREIVAANRTLVTAIGWVFFLFAIVIAVGILVGGGVFLVTFYWLQTDLSWPKIALITGGVTLFLWYVFQATLQVPIAEGMLFSLL